MGCSISQQVANQVVAIKESDKVDYENFIKANNGRYQDFYRVGKQLGQGSYGAVYEAYNIVTQQKKAIKKVSKCTITDEEQKRNVLKDIYILKELDHANIVKVSEFFQDTMQFYVVQELCEGGELLERVSHKGYLCENEAKRVIKQVLSAISYAHNQHIAHRDLKLDNVVLIQRVLPNELEYGVKVIDWGCSARFKDNQLMTELVGTPLYVAPEVIQQKYNEKADLWSVGVMIYILLSGEPPFMGQNIEDTFKIIQKSSVNFGSAIWKNISREAIDLIKQLLNKNYKLRPSAEIALQHKWFSSISQLSIPEDSQQKCLENFKKITSFNKFQQVIQNYIASQLISKEEQKILAENFKKIDINNDGAIAKKEIEDYLKSYMTQEEAQQAIDTILSKIDVNQNGKISYTEFLSHQMNFQNMQNEKNLLQAFQFFDQDNNKFITQEDINKISNFSPCGLDWNQVLQQYDKNLDKKIDFNEFKLIAEQIYKKNQ